MDTNVPSTSSAIEMSVNCSTSSTMSFCLLTLHTCHTIASRPGRRSGVDELTDNGIGSSLSFELEAAERVLKCLRNIYHTRLISLHMSIGAICDSSSLTMLRGRYKVGVQRTSMTYFLRSATLWHLGLARDASNSDGESTK